MSLKKINKKNIMYIIIIFFWLVYLFQAYTLFSEIKDFTTIGSSYIIQILEFTNYRADQLSFILIEYFIFISINSIIGIYLYFNNKSYLLFNIIFILILFFISNIFWSIYLVLTILSLLIIITGFFISNIFWNSKVTFKKGDIIYQSHYFNNKDEACSSLNRIINKINEENEDNTNKISSEICKNDNKFFFEIYALKDIELSNKGEYLFYE